MLPLQEFVPAARRPGPHQGWFWQRGPHWAQIVEWYDELVRLTDSPVARLDRAVAVGEAYGPRAGLAALAELDPALPRHAAVAAYLHERDGDPVTAARLYAEAARSAPNLPEREHLTRQAARLNPELRR